MSLLLSNYSDVKSWYKNTYQDFSSFLSPNDFEIALQDYSLLKDKNRFKKYSDDLRWFMFDKPGFYTTTLDSYASYLTYVILTQIYHNRNFSLGSYEAYFTEQLVGFLEAKKDYKHMLNFLSIQKYWEKCFMFLEYFVNTLSQYKKVVSNTSAYFNCNKVDNYRLEIPAIGLTETGITCHLILKYKGQKPSWYTVPSLFKIYRYYAEQDLKVEAMYIYWIDTSNYLSKIITESIPLTENVAEMVSRYASVEPYPYPNIFRKDSFSYFNKTPLDILLK